MSRIMPAPADGRAFTVYTSRCEYNAGLQSFLKASTQTNYRRALQSAPAAAEAYIRSIPAARSLPYRNVNACPPYQMKQNDVVPRWF